jgi:hypothetical protein
MTCPKGYADDTKSNYFVGRNIFEGFPSRQTMIRDGALKVRNELLDEKAGKTDNWLMAVHAAMDVPDRFHPLTLLPVKIPLKISVDLGNYTEAWDENNHQSRLLFDTGLQFRSFKNTFNRYVPIFYTRVYLDYFQSKPGNGF